MENFNLKKFLVENKLTTNSKILNEELKQPTDENSDLFSAEYRGKKIKIEGKFLKQGEEIELLQKLKKFNLGSGHERMKLSKINDDYFTFDLETYTGGPVQTIYFEKLK